MITDQGWIMIQIKNCLWELLQLLSTRRVIFYLLKKMSVAANFTSWHLIIILIYLFLPWFEIFWFVCTFAWFIERIMIFMSWFQNEGDYVPIMQSLFRCCKCRCCLSCKFPFVIIIIDITLFLLLDIENSELDKPLNGSFIIVLLKEAYCNLFESHFSL